MIYIVFALCTVLVISDGIICYKNKQILKNIDKIKELEKNENK